MSVHGVDWYYWPGCRGDSRTPCWWRLRGRRRPRLLWTLYILSCPENCQWSRSVWTRGQYLGLEHLQTPSRPWRRSRTRPEHLHVRTEWHWLATLFLEERRRTWVNRIEIWFLFTFYIYTRKIWGPVGLSVFSFTTDDYTTERETSEGVQQRLHYWCTISESYRGYLCQVGGQLKGGKRSWLFDLPHIDKSIRILIFMCFITALTL